MIVQLLLIAILSCTSASSVALFLPGPISVRANLFRSLGLAPLVVLLPYVVGAFFGGELSPWPATAFKMAGAGSAGAIAAVAVLIADFWLLCAAARTALIFAPEADGRLVLAHYVVNGMAGSGLIGWAIWRHGA